MRVITRGRSIRAGVAVSVAIATVALGLTSSSASAHPAGEQAAVLNVTSVTPAQGHGGPHGRPRAPLGGPRWFEVRCSYTHNGPQDPIVMPGMAGLSHNHEFFGNATTDENSTADSLAAGSTTCNDANDTSAYWVPSLYQDGVRVEPREAHIRYNLTRRGSVVAFPAGFMAISGRTNATAGWACLARGRRPVFSGDVATVPTCTGGSSLMARIVFPQCWDGSSVDSSDHASHLAWAVRGVCPADHPVQVPQVRVDVVYPAEATGGPGVTLASGAASTLHADIFEVWQGTSLQDRINSSLTPGGSPRGRGPGRARG